MKKANMLRLRFIDSVSGLKIYDVLQMLKLQQYLPKAAIDEINREKLDDLFAIAQQSTIHYAPYRSYKEIPVITKKIMQQHPGHFLSRFYQDKLFKKATGGSTGTPFNYHTSTDAQSHLWAGLILSWECAGYQFGDKVAFIAGSALIKSTTKHGIFYKLMNIDLYPAATMTAESIGTYLGTIRQKNTKLIYGYAMAINIIADYIIRNNIAPLPGLCGIVCTSEMLTDKMRENIATAFGVKVFNQYGCNEAGIAAFECEQHQLHLISSRTIVETDDEGRLIGTDLANDACIFMKYNTGDIVEFSDATCSCGRKYPVIKNIVGRSSDIITDRKNKKIHASYFNLLFKTDKSIKQYQVFFDDGSIYINLMVDNDFSEKRRSYYLDIIKQNLAFDTYDIKTNEQFYTSSNLKHTFIIDKRKQQYKAA